MQIDVEITLVIDGSGGYEGFLRYASDIFSPQTAHDIQAALCMLLEQVVYRPDIAVGSVLDRLSLPTRCAK